MTTQEVTKEINDRINIPRVQDSSPNKISNKHQAILYVLFLVALVIILYI